MGSKPGCSGRNAFVYGIVPYARVMYDILRASIGLKFPALGRYWLPRWQGYQ
jgi:hypothetical protein